MRCGRVSHGQPYLYGEQHFGLCRPGYRYARHIEADKTGSSHATILELLAYIEEYYNRDIGLNELADRAGMSTAYLSVLFKSEVGTSHVKYMTDLRIKQDKKLLKERYKASEGSEKRGYNNYSNFCAIF